jgi:hypothetical protein
MVWFLLFVLLVVCYFAIGIIVTKIPASDLLNEGEPKWKDTLKRAAVWPKVFFSSFLVLLVLSLMPMFAIAETPTNIKTTVEPGTAGRVQVVWSWTKSVDINKAKYRFRCSTNNKLTQLPIYIEIPATVPIADEFTLVMKLPAVPTYCCISLVNKMGLESACSTPLTVIPAFLPPAPLTGVKAVVPKVSK